MRVRVLPSAKRDLSRGISFYEKQETGLGSYFLDSIGSDIDSLHQLAGVHRMSGGHYRYLSERFPYWIENGVAYVVAVLDARQDPAKIRKREDAERNRAE